MFGAALVVGVGRICLPAICGRVRVRFRFRVTRTRALGRGLVESSLLVEDTADCLLVQTYFCSSSCPYPHCPQYPLSIPPVAQGPPHAASCPTKDSQRHEDEAHQLAPCFHYCYFPQSVCGSHVCQDVKTVPLVAQLFRLCAVLSRGPPNSCRGSAAHSHVLIGRVCLC